MIDRTEFIRANTALVSPPLVPEIKLHLATEVVPLWQLTEEELAAQGIPPPYWAFAWAGGQALSRYVLDHPEIVKSKSVLDFGSGSGLVAIAAAKAGADRVMAADIDDFAQATIKLNAAAHLKALQSDENVLVLEKLVRLYQERTGHPPASLVDLVYANMLRDVPLDPAGRPYKLTSDGRIEVRNPDDIPFITQGLPPGYKPPVAPDLDKLKDALQ